MMVLIYIYYDGSQYKDIFILYEIFDDKILISYKLWIVIRIIYLKGLFPHPNVFEFHLLSYLTPPPPPFISLYRCIRVIIGVETCERQQLRTILWNWGVYYDFYGVKLCTKELFWRCFVFGGLELCHLWWDFRLLVSFI